MFVLSCRGLLRARSLGGCFEKLIKIKKGFGFCPVFRSVKDTDDFTLGVDQKCCGQAGHAELVADFQFGIQSDREGKLLCLDIGSTTCAPKISLEMAIIAKFRFLNFWYSSSNDGISTLQGPHQVAQKLTSRYFPAKSSSVNSWLSSEDRENCGALTGVSSHAKDGADSVRKIAHRPKKKFG